MISKAQCELFVRQCRLKQPPNEFVISFETFGNRDGSTHTFLGHERDRENQKYQGFEMLGKVKME